MKRSELKLWEESEASEDRIKEEKRIADASYKHLKRQRKALKEQGLTYVSIFALVGDSYAAFEIRDLHSVNVEDQAILNCLVQILFECFARMNAEDVELLYAFYLPGRGQVRSLARARGVPEHVLYYRRKVLIQQLRKEFHVDAA